MTRVEELLQAYRSFVRMPWNGRVSPAERVWFGLYEPAEERRLRFRIQNFEVETMEAGHGWLAADLSEEFARWMSAHDYRESYFESPEDVTEDLLDDFAEHTASVVGDLLKSPEADDDCVVALYGMGSLFGLLRISHLLEMVSDSVKGRLLVFFPGEHDGGNYRLMDARDGWNYLAVPVNARDIH